MRGKKRKCQEDSECVVMFLCVHTSGGKRETNSKGGKIKRV